MRIMEKSYCYAHCCALMLFAKLWPLYFAQRAPLTVCQASLTCSSTRSSETQTLARSFYWEMYYSSTFLLLREVPYFEVLTFLNLINSDSVNPGWSVLLAGRWELVEALHKEELRGQDCEAWLDEASRKKRGQERLKTIKRWQHQYPQVNPSIQVDWCRYRWRRPDFPWKWSEVEDIEASFSENPLSWMWSL